MNQQVESNYYASGRELRRLFFISIGVFLFILFFQPFPLVLLDYNNRLLYVAGFGSITFVVASFVMFLLPVFQTYLTGIHDNQKKPRVYMYILLFVFTYTAYAFYIYFVGKTSLTLYVLFKILLVCVLPVIILVILYKNELLETLIVQLTLKNKELNAALQQKELNLGENEVTLYSSNKTEKITLQAKCLVMINSADNYVEITVIENDTVRKKLLRNTLKEIESQISTQQLIMRCHRAYIVNTMFIKKIIKSYHGYNLKIEHVELPVPVSKQYITSLKASM